MTASGDRRQLLDRFRAGYAAVEQAVAGIAEDELDRRPPSGEWTAREVVHHLADSETHAYVRLRRLIAEDEPLIEGYDEPEYARRLHYDRPIETSLAVLRAVRDSSLELLETLTTAEWSRSGRHSDSGAYSVDEWLQIYANHSADHAEQIRRAVRGEA